MKLFQRQNWPWRFSTLLVVHSSQWLATRKATFSGWILSQKSLTVSSSAQPVQLLCIHQCSSIEHILTFSSCSMTNRSGPAKKQFYIARLLAATHVPPCIGWRWISESSTTPLSISLSIHPYITAIHPTTASPSIFYNTIINLEKGWREDWHNIWDAFPVQGSQWTQVSLQMHG